MTLAVRIYSSGAVSDVVPTSPWSGPPALAQSLSVGGITWQSNTGLYVALSGPTTSRPMPWQLSSNIFNKSNTGLKFFDTTLSKLLVFDGVGRWIDPAAGAFV